MSSYTLSWDGKMLPCQILGCFYNEPFNEGFQKSWDKLPSKIKVPDENNMCQRCSLSRFCSSCFASRFIETGKFDECPQYIYEDASHVYNLIK
ncbi:hypothetical protein SDC9_178862 [bioreactor metagenome]|uniref:4Fe4S-binding SPASM domain-containing protein n=1 Tax=bioreactor metagenome TaxID=1076179 RepID=A0A645GXD7_9ZZZZ